MTADRFFEMDFAITVSLFYSAFDDSVFVPETINAHFSLYGRRYPSEIFIILVSSVLFNPFNAFFSKIRLHGFVDVVNDLQFIFFERSPGITIFTAAALAFHQVANKLRLTTASLTSTLSIAITIKN
jgi:hypothetical protein